MDTMGSLATTPSSSYQQSPSTSYNPSPPFSSFPSPPSHGNSLIPWLKNPASSSTSSASSSKFIHHYLHCGSISAPVTPPLSPPTGRTPRIKTVLDGSFDYPFLPFSTPPSPTRPILPDSNWNAGIQFPQSGPTSPTFSLVSSNPFGFRVEDLAQRGYPVCTTGQSGMCSPAAAAASERTGDIPMAELIPNEFAFGSNVRGLVKPWEGERIHEECGSDELELTLATSKTRYNVLPNSAKAQKSTL